MKKINAVAALAVITAVTGTSGAYLAFAEAQPAYYVCYSTENYAVRNANKLKEENAEYVLENVKLNSLVDFYVTDNAGRRWYAADGKELSVDETATLSYNIKFSPEKTFTGGDGWEGTGCNVTYRFYAPEEYSVTVGGQEQKLTYNPYRTAYDEYYISSLEIASGATVAYGGETHKVEHDGHYRILFTPEERKNGNDYAYNADGVYGTGSGYDFRIYIEDAPQYFYKVYGESEYKPLSRYENNVAAKEYASEEFFADGRDYILKYCIYERDLSGNYRLIDDDNDEDTAYSEIKIADAGWYALHFTDGGEVFSTRCEYEKRNLGGYYLAGEFNGYLFDADGNLNKDDRYKFTEVERGDDDYDEDYAQYVAYLTVTEKDLKGGDVEFYITDGKDKYKNGASYVSVSRAGRYKILFSDEKLYGNGRHYRYTLEEENAVYEEVEIGTVTQFLTFAENCTKSADYSKNKAFYLTADLDFTGADFAGVGEFSGKFYGGYHKLYNIALDEDCASVFNVVKRDGVIERLICENLTLTDGEAYAGVVGKNYGTVNGVTVYGSVKGETYVGGVVGYNGRSAEDETSGSADTNKVYRNGVIKNCKNYATVGGTVHCGGVCGFNAGEITACENLGKISYIKQSSSSSPFNLGGIAGYSAGKITDCANSAQVDGGSEALYVGGVCGLCTGEIYFSFNSAAVSGRRHVGGVAGYYGKINQDNDGNYLGGLTYEEIYDKYFKNDGSFEEADGLAHTVKYCINTGAVTATSYAGGILGYSDAAGLKISCCESTGDVTVTAGSYAGGVAGYEVGGEIESCVTGGEISAKGMNGGKYVGGIVGYGENISACSSVCALTGTDYLGGIAGYNKSGLCSSWASVVIIPADGAKNVGNIAGFTEDLNEAADKFTDGFKDNYYIGENYGGVGGRNYAGSYSFAATPVDSATLAFTGSVSPYLSDGFNAENKWRGFDAPTYPSPRYLTEADECKEFNDDEEFARLFAVHADKFEVIARANAEELFTLTFLEWNEDNGALYDDGELQYGNFEAIKTVRLPLGSVAEIPAFKWAHAAGGKFIYNGDEASYFVTFPEVASVTGNAKIYAVYKEIATTVATDDDKVLVEGVFDANTKVELVQSVNGYTLKFTLDGEVIDVGAIKVKFRPDGGVKDKTLLINGEDGGAEISGEYLAFTFEDGDFFAIADGANGGLPAWAWGLIGGAVGAAAVAAAGAITYVVLRKKTKKQGENNDNG